VKARIPPTLLLACLAWLFACGIVIAAAGSAVPAGQRREVRHADLSLFTHSENCVACHNSLVTPAGEDVSIGSAWRSTMMANSARDPYWQAGVRRETLDHPLHSAAIQDECAQCHMPMATQIARAAQAASQLHARAVGCGY